MCINLLESSCHFQGKESQKKNEWKSPLLILQRFRVIWGQRCPRVSAGPCLSDGPITQLSPYYTQNPCSTHLRTNVPLTTSNTFSVDSTGRSSKNLEMLIRMLKAKMVSTADLQWMAEDKNRTKTLRSIFSVLRYSSASGRCFVCFVLGVYLGDWLLHIR